MKSIKQDTQIAFIGAGDLARASGIAATTVSGQLKRLETEGLVEKTALAGTRRSGYQVSERFFNIWYLMRHGRPGDRRRALWLVPRTENDRSIGRG